MTVLSLGLGFNPRNADGTVKAPHPKKTNYYCTHCKCTTKHDCKCDDLSEAMQAVEDITCEKCGTHKFHPGCICIKPTK